MSMTFCAYEADISALFSHVLYQNRAFLQQEKVYAPVFASRGALVNQDPTSFSDASQQSNDRGEDRCSSIGIGCQVMQLCSL